jgi:hypothetical protein
MMEPDDLEMLAMEIMSQGYDEATADRLAVRIGDTPCYDEAGNIVVENKSGQVMAILKPLRFFGGR